MSGSCYEKLPHSCGTSDALQVFQSDTGFDGYCFSCHEYVPNPYGEKASPARKAKPKKSSEEIAAEIAEIQALPTVDVTSRKLKAASLEYFGVKVAVSETDGETPTHLYYPCFSEGELIGYKVKFLLSKPKKIWAVGTTRNAEMFGWEQALASGASKLYITEGEDDAVAILQALKNKNKGTKWDTHSPAVVSISHGSSSAKKEIAEKLPLIRATFKEIILVFDQDASGKKAVEEVMQVAPEAKSAILPSKDANQCLIDGRERALVNAVLFNAERPKNTRLVWARDVIAQAREAPEWGLEWPWEGLTNLTRGMRFGETVYIGAGVKMGKSTMVSTLIAHLIQKHKMKVFVAAPEETNKKTVQLTTGKVAGRIFHDPKVPFDYDAYDKAASVVSDSLCMLDVYQIIDWNTLRVDIVSAIQEGCQAIFIDPITNITNAVNAGDANRLLQELAQELAALAKDMNVIVFLFCHLKAPENGPPHERGGKVFSNQFAGSRAMMRSCNLMLGLEGNKDPDIDESLRNMRRLIVLEDREFGATGVVNLFWDKDTGLFNEVKE